MATQLTLAQVRELTQATWTEVAGWFTAKPRVFTLPHPEQQLLFEYAARLRSALRNASGQSGWDRLYFDTSTCSLGSGSVSHSLAAQPPLLVDTRRLFGLSDQQPPDVNAPNLAVAIQVLRSAPGLLHLDDDGEPRTQRWMPTGIRQQGWLLEQHVSQLEEWSQGRCDGFLFVVYSNEARRRTAVDTREVASWATWQAVSETLWCASRHFRVRSAP